MAATLRTGTTLQASVGGYTTGHVFKGSYLSVIVCSGESNFGGFFPDLPGCVATGDTVQLVKSRLEEAVHAHILGSLEDGEPFPPAVTQSFAESPSAGTVVVEQDIITVECQY